MATSFFLSLFMNELVQQKAVYIISFRVMVVREIKYHWIEVSSELEKSGFEFVGFKM